MRLQDHLEDDAVSGGQTRNFLRRCRPTMHCGSTGSVRQENREKYPGHTVVLVPVTVKYGAVLWEVLCLAQSASSAAGLAGAVVVVDRDRDKKSGLHSVLELLKKEGLLEFASGVDRSFRWNLACRLQIPTFLLNREEKKAGAVCSAM